MQLDGWDAETSVPAILDGVNIPSSTVKHYDQQSDARIMRVA